VADNHSTRPKSPNPTEGSSDATTAAGGAPSGEVVVIKKYANRRLYNTASSSYVTLEHLSDMVRSGVDFMVLDAKTEDDITRSVLTQIIVEQESRGQNLLPVEFLRRLIRFYGEPMQGFLPAYLNMSMESFSKSQEQFRDQFSRAFGAKTPMAAFEEQARQNMALFQQAMSVWGAPFTPPGGAPRVAPAEETPTEDGRIDDMKRQLEAMQKQLDAIANPLRKP